MNGSSSNMLSYFHFFDGKWVLILNWKIPINHMLCSVSVGPIPPLPPHPNLHSILSSLPSFSLCPGSYSPLLLLSLLNYFFPSLPPTLCSFPPSFLSFPLPPLSFSTSSSHHLLPLLLVYFLPICYLDGSSYTVPILNYSFHILNNPWLQICRGAFTISAAFGSRRHVTQFSKSFQFTNIPSS